MNYFIVKEDILQTYPLESLDRLTNNTDLIWQNEIIRAVEEISAFLRARYDVNLIFAPVTFYTALLTFVTGQRVYDNVAKKHYVCIKDAVAGTLLTNTTYFTESDTRNQKVVEMTVDTIVYKLLSRLNSIDMPKNRKERYDGDSPLQTGGVIGYLKNIAKGLLQMDLPLIEANQLDQTGNRVMYGEATVTQNEKFVW